MRRRHNAFSVAEDLVLIAISAVGAGGTIASNATGVAWVAGTISTEVFSCHAGSAVVGAGAIASQARTIARRAV